MDYPAPLPKHPDTDPLPDPEPISPSLPEPDPEVFRPKGK